jgi:hypothetical protein
MLYINIFVSFSPATIGVQREGNIFQTEDGHKA